MTNIVYLENITEEQVTGSVEVSILNLAVFLESEHQKNAPAYISRLKGLVALGTQGGVQTPEKGTSSYLLRTTVGPFLLDAGYGTTMAIHQVKGEDVVSIENVFIGHHHDDHTDEIVTLIYNRSFKGSKKVLNIFSPSKAAIHALKKQIKGKFEECNDVCLFRVNLIYIGDVASFVYKGFEIHLLPTDHTPHSRAYKFKETNAQDIIDVQKAIVLGVPKGVELGMLKKGQSVETPEKNIVTPQDVSKKETLKEVVYFGDTYYHEEYAEFCRESSLVIFEGTFIQDKVNPSMMEEYKHSTIEQALTIAKNSACKKLLVTHFSVRYKPEEYQEVLEKSNIQHAELIENFRVYNL